MVRGYKAFNINGTNRYGMPFVVGETYSIDGDISFGVNGNGFHMCTNLEDVFRYFDAFNDDVLVAKVIGYGKTVCYNDEYNGFYDMYAVEKIKIESFLTRDEIVDTFLSEAPYRVCRFVSLFKLSSDEIDKFKNVYSDEEAILAHLAYYQENKKNTFYKKYIKTKN